MKNLERNQILEALENVKNGRLARICYQTEVPVKSEYKKAGIRVIKTVEKTVRIGIYYGNIASVKAKALEAINEVPVPKKESPFEWIIPNRIRKHKNNNKEYLQIAHLKHGSNKKEMYTVYFENDVVNVPDRKTFEEYNFQEYVQPSRWDYSDKAPSEVQFITLNNIIRINDVGEHIKFN